MSEYSGEKPSASRAKAGSGIESRRVAGPSWTHFNWHFASGDTTDGLQDFAYRQAISGSEIDCEVPATVDEVLKCQKMGARQIRHVDIVANTGSIFGVVVVAEDRKVRDCTAGREQRSRNEMRLRLHAIRQVRRPDRHRTR